MVFQIKIFYIKLWQHELKNQLYNVIHIVLFTFLSIFYTLERDPLATLYTKYVKHVIIHEKHKRIQNNTESLPMILLYNVPKSFQSVDFLLVVL